jgi:mono/diheme cytochrome c family protein
MKRRPAAVLTLALLSLAAASARADGPRMPLHVPPAYTQECGACHTAYPPGLLPARSWQRLMGGLERHFGSDATLDPATVSELSAWLQQHAGRARRVADSPPQDRITRSEWFERKHRAIEPAVWALPSVRSAAQCAACHRGAGQGRFDDDGLITPSGLSARQRRAWAD